MMKTHLWMIEALKILILMIRIALIFFLKNFGCTWYHYSNQGYPFKIIPFLSWVYYLKNTKKEKWNQLACLKELIDQQPEDKKIIIFNSAKNNSKADILLFDIKFIKDFIKKEKEGNFIKNGGDLNQISDNLHNKLIRKVNPKFFKVEHISKNIPKIYKILEKHIKKAFDNGNDNSCQTLDLRQVIKNANEEIVDKILFGFQKNKEVKKVKEEKLSNLSTQIFTLKQKLSMNRFNKLFCEYPEKLGLLKNARELKRVKKLAENKIWEEFNKICQKKDLNEEDGVIGMIAKYKLEENPNMTRDEVVKNINGFYVGVEDTLISATSGAFFNLIHNPEYIEKLRKSIKKTVWKNGYHPESLSIEDLQKSELLDLIFKETLRISGPAIMSAPRIAVKDVTLVSDKNKNQIKIRKGDRVILGNTLKSQLKCYFENPLKFIPERHNNENKRNIKGYSTTPFLYGTRGCVGKNMAENLLKISIVCVMDHLEFLEYEPKEIKGDKMILDPFYTPENVWVRAGFIKKFQEN